MSRVTARRTQIYLTEEQYQYLREKAGDYGSVAGAIRSLIEEKMSAPRDYQKDPFYQWATAPATSGISDLGSNHDKYIYDEEKR
ncbi:MAG: hypothetical protein DDT18_01628 [Actinobacteria bacterium]|nr:hypothetical protein [Actinomycetota bacterium]